LAGYRSVACSRSSSRTRAVCDGLFVCRTSRGIQVVAFRSWRALYVVICARGCSSKPGLGILSRRERPHGLASQLSACGRMLTVYRRAAHGACARCFRRRVVVLDLRGLFRGCMRAWCRRGAGCIGDFRCDCHRRHWPRGSTGRSRDHILLMARGYASYHGPHYKSCFEAAAEDRRYDGRIHSASAWHGQYVSVSSG